MSATTPLSRAAALVVAATLVVSACTSPGPDTLARAEETTAPTLPPVTTSPLGTVVTASSTSGPATSAPGGATSDGTDDGNGPEQEIAVAGLARIEEQLVPLLGPTSNLSVAMNTIVPFPRSVPTPPGAEITEISIGAGTPSDDGTVIAQVGVTVSTTTTSAAVFQSMTNAVRAGGMFAIDTKGEGENRSASFRIPGGDQFDELVITATPDGDQATVRIVANAAIRISAVAAFIDWADSELPLPAGDQRRTLIVAASSGEGRLAAQNLTVESSVILEGASAQRQANRLVGRAADSETFGTDADPTVDQALTGPLTFDGLDDLAYWVVPTIRTTVDSEGELKDVDAIEVRLVGSKSL